MMSKATYKDFKEEMIKRFHYTQPITAMNKFMNCTQERTEDPQAYALRLQTLAEDVFSGKQEDAIARAAAREIIESQLLNRFLAGLRQTIRPNVMIRDPATFRTAVEIAVKEAENERMEELYKPKVRALSEAPFHAEMESVMQRLGKMETIFQKNKQPDRPNTKTQGCFLCSKVGHIAMYCPQRPNGRGLMAQKCFNCNRIGHFARDCRQPRRQNQVFQQNGGGFQNRNYPRNSQGGWNRFQGQGGQQNPRRFWYPSYQNSSRSDLLISSSLT
jgi:hypothetical protein